MPMDKILQNEQANSTRSDLGKGRSFSVARKLYVSGGNSGETVLASVEEYTAELDSWALVTPMPGPRSNHRMVTHGACIYVIGGYSGRRRLDDGHGLTAEVQHYSSGSDTWRSVVAPLTQPLGAMDACVVAGLPVVRRLSGR
ncbi:kelch-like protein 7 [Rhipicephalus microplus]|uniref:kelch-like protein 7 n=1 Tax=Rhipicephalus microplus TaxID=6941 RepID=UPI003F6D2AF0